MVTSPRPRAVRARREFDALSRSRRRGRAAALWVVQAEHVDDGDTSVAVAYSIGRPVGSAVVRNRLRRRLRAVMAERAAAGLHHGLYLVGVTPAAADLTYAEVRDQLDAALDDLS